MSRSGTDGDHADAARVPGRSPVALEQAFGELELELERDALSPVSEMA
jgi:hypothetical protein